jgi:hypothetical protein
MVQCMLEKEGFNKEENKLASKSKMFIDYGSFHSC